MLALIQRVKEARVDVGGAVVGAIAQGLLIFLGIARKAKLHFIAVVPNRLSP